MLDNVGRATGFTDACTCPRAYLSLTWVRRGARAYAYREKGSLAMVERSPLPAPLADALDVIGGAYGERMTREFEDRKRKHDIATSQNEARRMANGG